MAQHQTSANEFMNQPHLTRREFLAASASLILGATIHAADPPVDKAERIIDIHQHTNYGGRTDEQLIAHQRAMGIRQTLLLPAGTSVLRPSTHDGKSNGLATQCGGNETALALAKEHPKEFLFGAN